MKIICIIFDEYIGWSFLVKINYYNGSNNGNINDIIIIMHCLMEKALEVYKNIGLISAVVVRPAINFYIGLVILFLCNNKYLHRKSCSR